MYFGLIEEAIKKKQEVFTVSKKCTVETLENLLLESYPVLNNFTYQIAVNQSLQPKITVLNENAEVAILPPFAGG